jgi:hypothetical protein
LIVESRIIRRGKKFSLHELLVNGRSQVREFYENLEENVQDDIYAILESILELGPLERQKYFVPERDGIFAIKHKQDQIRIYCFFDDKSIIILAHGVIKKKQKADQDILKKCIKLKKEYLRQKG